MNGAPGLEQLGEGSLIRAFRHALIGRHPDASYDRSMTLSTLTAHRIEIVTRPFLCLHHVMSGDVDLRARLEPLGVRAGV